MWISYFRAPKQFSSDNGEKFNTEGYQLINEKLNIERCTIAEESPFTNVTVKCHNIIVAEIMDCPVGWGCRIH